MVKDRNGSGDTSEPLYDGSRTKAGIAVHGVLGRLGRRSSIAKLVKTLLSEDSNLQSSAVDALARIGVPSLEGLIEALHSPGFEPSSSATTLIGKMPGPQVLPKLLPLLSSPNDWVRRCVAEALGEIGDPLAIEALAGHLGDHVHMVRCEIVKALKKLGWQPHTVDERAICAVAVRHEDVVMQKFRDAVAMGKPAVGPLSVALETGNWVAAENAARALGEIGDESALPGLENACAWNLKEKGTSFNTPQEQALIALTTMLAKMGRITPIKEDVIAALLSAEMPSTPSSPLERVATAEDLVVGDFIRVWHGYLDKWATGWMEVLYKSRERVCLRCLPGGDLYVRYISDTIGDTWRWPRAERRAA